MKFSSAQSSFGTQTITGDPASLNGTIEVDGLTFTTRDLKWTLGSTGADLVIAPQSLTSISSIKFGNEAPAEHVYGQGYFAMAIAKGQIKPKDFSLKMWATAWESLCAQVPGGKNAVLLSPSVFSFALSLYNETVSDRTLMWVIRQAVVTSDDFSFETSAAGAVQVDITFKPRLPIVGIVL
jgi:hypothetical protein